MVKFLSLAWSLVALAAFSSGAPPALPLPFPLPPGAPSVIPDTPSGLPKTLGTATAIEDLSLALNLIQEAHQNEIQEPLTPEAKKLEPLKPVAAAAVDLINVLAEALSPLNQEYEQARARFENGGVAPVTTETPVVIGQLLFDDEPAPINSISDPIQPVQPAALVEPATSIEPATTVQPSTSVAPVQPVAPVNPFASAHPIAPVQPSAPVQDATHVQPETSVAPVQPIVPVQPIAPVQPAAPVVPSSTFEVLTPMSSAGVTSFKVAPPATIAGLRPNPLPPLDLNIPANAQNGFSYMVHTPKGYYTQIFYG